MERWSKFDTEGVRLAKIRIYKPQSETPRIVVFVPPEDGGGDNGDEDIYELDMLKQKVENQIVVAERAKAPSGTGRARTTIMTGQIKHECNLRPCMTGRYKRRLMERRSAANEKPMRVKLMDGARAGRGGGKMLSSGITSAGGFADITVGGAFVSGYILFTDPPSFLQRAKNEPTKSQNERMTRMPRNQLLDALFALFREREQWPIKILREKIQQPEVYLKEVLSEIATLHRSGEFNNTWELMPSFKRDGVGLIIVVIGCNELIFVLLMHSSRRRACRSCMRLKRRTRMHWWTTMMMKRVTWRRSWNRFLLSHHAFVCIIAIVS